MFAALKPYALLIKAGLIIAALITPSPDVTSQLLVAVPLFLLYEVSIYVSAAVNRNRERDLI